MYENQRSLGGSSANFLVGRQELRDLSVATVESRADLQPGG